MQTFVLIITEEDPFRPEREPTGFFPPINKASRPATAAEEPLMPAYQSATSSGFVPNSVLVKILWPPPPPQPEKSQESWRPPSLSDGQLEEIEKEKVFTNFLLLYHCISTLQFVLSLLNILNLLVINVFLFVYSLFEICWLSFLYLFIKRYILIYSQHLLSVTIECFIWPC